MEQLTALPLASRPVIISSFKSNAHRPVAGFGLKA
jgi:hypothetical protein